MPQFTLGLIFQTTITVTDDEISGRGTMTNWSIPRSTIAGYRLASKHIWLCNADGKNIQSISRDSGADDFVGWLKVNYDNVDAVAMEHEKQEILADETYGQTVEQREVAFSMAQRISYVLLGASAVIFGLQFLAGSWQPVLFCLACAIPLIATFYYRRYRGLLRILDSKGNAYSILWPTYGVILLYFVVSYLRRDTLQADSLMHYAPAVAGAWIVVFFVLASATLQRERNRWLSTGLAAVYLITLSYFTVGAANCTFDHAIPTIYRVQVTDMHINHGSKSTIYYIRLEPWGPRMASRNESVSSSFYDATNIGDSVTVVLHPGALGTQWYELGR